MIIYNITVTNIIVNDTIVKMMIIFITTVTIIVILNIIMTITILEREKDCDNCNCWCSIARGGSPTGRSTSQQTIRFTTLLIIWIKSTFFCCTTFLLSFYCCFLSRTISRVWWPRTIPTRRHKCFSFVCLFLNSWQISSWIIYEKLNIVFL